MTNTRHRPPIDALTSLRGIAALLVVVHHMCLLMLPLQGTIVAPALGNFGVLGMTTFFTLSGFVIHYNYADRLAVERGKGVLSFLFARFARLYPLYLPVILLNFLLNFGNAVHHGNVVAANAYTAALPVNLAGMQSWFYAVSNGFNLTISQGYANNSWSISVEFLLYLVFIPIALYGGFKRHSLWRGIVLTVFAMVMRTVFIRLANDEHVVNGMTQTWGALMVDPAAWLSYYSPYGRFFEFLAGIGIAEIWLSAPAQGHSARSRLIARGLGFIAIAYIVGSLFDRTLYDVPKLFGGYRLFSGYAIALPLAIYAICQSRNLLGKLASAAPLMFCGEISYSLYMLHGNLFPLFRMAPGGDLAAQAPGMIWRAVAFLVILFVSSWLAYRYLEMPARRWIMKFYKSAMTTTTTATATATASTTPTHQPSAVESKITEHGRA